VSPTNAGGRRRGVSLTGASPASLRLAAAGPQRPGRARRGHDASEVQTKNAQAFERHRTIATGNVGGRSRAPSASARGGYRRTRARLPLRKTLAAGIVGLTGWSSGEPLLDPMCGQRDAPHRGGR